MLEERMQKMITPKAALLLPFTLETPTHIN
jgi:hypothetical protein